MHSALPSPTLRSTKSAGRVKLPALALKVDLNFQAPPIAKRDACCWPSTEMPQAPVSSWSRVESCILSLTSSDFESLLGHLPKGAQKMARRLQSPTKHQSGRFARSVHRGGRWRGVCRPPPQAGTCRSE